MTDTESQPTKPKPAENNPELPQTAPLDTFGERIESAVPSEPDEFAALDQYGLPLYREHDEFAEWLRRHTDQDPI